MSTAYIVDDDAAIRDALMWLLKSRSVPAKAWPSAEAFLAEYDENMTGCLLLDIRMNGMTGMELMEQLQERSCRMPVIFLTGHGDVAMAVSALKRGAYDFVEKPFNDNDLVDRILEALDRDSKQRHEQASQASVESRLQSLTKREQEVMDRILAGKLNKIIADELGIATRTVEVHRSRLFDKMGVKSAVELAQLLSRRR
jgi:two-component system, LuxR family, response regulator DctR